MVITIAAQWPWLNLHDDVRFTLGPLRAAAASYGPLDTFVHRPMANRLLMAGLDALTGGPVPLREKITVALAIIAVGGAALVLHWALLRHTTATTTPETATIVALAVFGSLAWASEAYVLQPEWTATVLSVAGLGAALLWLRSGRWSQFAAAAGLLAVAVLQKYTTVTAALLALLVIFVVDRRRALWLAAVSAGATLVLLGLSFVVGRYEWQWFTETSALNPSAGVRFDAFGEFVVNWAWNNPVLLAWPAAAALAARLTRRRSWVWGCVTSFGVVLAATVLQNQFFAYHGTPLLPVAAATVSFAATTWTQRHGTILLGLVVLAGWVGVSWFVYPAPVRWRFDYRFAMAGWLLLVVVIIAVVVWLQALRQAQGTVYGLSKGAGDVALSLSKGAGDVALSLSKGAMLVLLLVLAITFPGWPGTPYGFFGQDRSRRSEVERQAELITDGEGVRAVVRDANVVYLADGETVYFVADPTDCAYPGAVVLYRSNVAGVGELRSFADNLACLSDPAARFLVLQTWRVPFSDLDPRVGETVAREYDCDSGTAVRELLVCPRRF